MRILLLAHKFKGENHPKKLFGTKSLDQSWRSVVFFVLEQNFTHAWGAQAVFLRSTGPEMHSSGTGLVTFVRGAILTWGGTLFAGGGAQT